MNVGELREYLKELPEDMKIILQKDCEGNGYSPLAGGDDEYVYVEENSYSGEVYSKNWSIEDCCMEDEEEEYNRIMNSPSVLVLYPIN